MKKKCITYILLAMCTLLFIGWAVRRGTYGEDDVYNELVSLDPSVEMVDLEKKGYIDVTDPLTEKNKKIEEFMENARNRRFAVLKIAKISDGRLCAKMLFYNKELDRIQMWTLYPNKQQMEYPGKRFNTKYEIVKEDNVTTVNLKNVPNESYPFAEKQIMIDEELYSYIDEGA